jgi:hypothetical protein
MGNFRPVHHFSPPPPCSWLGLALLVALPACAAPRILILGDSWAQGIWVARALDEVLLEYNIVGVETAGETTAIGGTKASDWADASHRATITAALNANPTIDSIHLVLGGNDILAHIKDTDAYSGIGAILREGWWNAIKADLQTVVNHCLSHAQVKHVVIADYDYLNRTTAQLFYSPDGGQRGLWRNEPARR